MQARHIRPRVLHRILHNWLERASELGAGSSAPPIGVCQPVLSCSAATVPPNRLVALTKGAETFQYRHWRSRSPYTTATAAAEGTGTEAAAQKQAGSVPGADSTQSNHSNPLDIIMAGSPVTCAQLPSLCALFLATPKPSN